MPQATQCSHFLFAPPLLLTHIGLASWTFLVLKSFRAAWLRPLLSRTLAGAPTPAPSPPLPPELGTESCAHFGALISTSFPPYGQHTQTLTLYPQDAEQDHEPPYEISVQEEVTARLHFVKFENTYIEACLDFIKDHLVNTETKVIQATGGGAYKFKDLIEEKLRLRSVGAMGAAGHRATGLGSWLGLPHPPWG